MLQEQFRPHIGANPIALLSGVERNMVGRIQVAPTGTELSKATTSIEVTQILKGDNSEVAFANLVRQYALSGVSGVVPKFLHESVNTLMPGTPLGEHKKANLITRRHIVKGSSKHLPFIALNEHLCMQVASRVLQTAKTQVSEDGQALVVHRFDVDEFGQPQWGMQDFCSLLGLRYASKYDTTWKRISKAVRDNVPAEHRFNTFRQLACIMLLTYALRNADCHAKNLALLYTTRTMRTYLLYTTCSPRAYTMGISITHQLLNSWGKNLGTWQKLAKVRRSYLWNFTQRAGRLGRSD